MLNAKCLPSNQETLRSEDSLLVSEGECPFQLLDFALIGHRRPVGSGKTAITLALCRRLRDTYNIGWSY